MACKIYMHRWISTHSQDMQLCTTCHAIQKWDKDTKKWEIQEKRASVKQIKPFVKPLPLEW